MTGFVMEYFLKLFEPSLVVVSFQEQEKVYFCMLLMKKCRAEDLLKFWHRRSVSVILGYLVLL